MNGHEERSTLYSSSGRYRLGNADLCREATHWARCADNRHSSSSKQSARFNPIEDHADELADFRVLGEAEGIIDEFIAAWDAGARKGTFTAEKFAIDITKTPIPRFDLLKRDQYIYYGVQFARGCPFTCEFCDIIELYGRAPRVKTAEQILAELDTLYRTGYRGHLKALDGAIEAKGDERDRPGQHARDYTDRPLDPEPYERQGRQKLCHAREAQP